MPVLARPAHSFWMLIGLIALCASGKAILYDTLDPDCFWHLRVAQQLTAEGIRPLVDHLSFASIKDPWTPYSWLAELGMKIIWDAGGYRAAILAQAAMAAAFVLFIGLSARIGTPSAGSRMAACVATAFAAFVSLPYLSFRPATLALALLAGGYCIVQYDRSRNNRSRRVWLLVPLTALLANIHLYAFLIPLWVTALLMGELLEHKRAGQYALLLPAVMLAALATPMLPGVIQTILHYQFHDPMVAGAAISEMQPFWHGTMGSVSAILVLGFFACALSKRRQLSASDWLLLGGSTVMLLGHGRYAPLFAIVAAPVLTRTFPTLSDRPLTRPLLSGALVTLLILGIGRLTLAFPGSQMNLSHWLNRHGPETPGYPTAAADFVESQITPHTGRVINEFTWGGYLEWRLGDRYQVLLDGRTQLYSPQFWQAAYLGSRDELTALLTEHQADAAVLPARNSRFHNILTASGWRTVYADDRAQVLIPPQPLSASGF